MVGFVENSEIPNFLMQDTLSSSSSSKMCDKCSLILDLLESNNSAMPICVSQNVSSINTTFTNSFPFSSLYRRISLCSIISCSICVSLRFSGGKHEPHISFDKHVVLDNIVHDVFKLCKGKKEKGGRDFSLPPEVHRSMPTARCFFACCTAFSALRRRLKISRSRVFS